MVRYEYRRVSMCYAIEKTPVVVLTGTMATQDAIDHLKGVAEKVEDVKSVDISALKVTST